MDLTELNKEILLYRRDTLILRSDAVRKRLAAIHSLIKEEEIRLKREYRTLITIKEVVTGLTNNYIRRLGAE